MKIHGNKRYNKYDLSGEFGIGHTRKNIPFYFDLEDFDLIKNYCWHIGGGERLVTRNPKGGTGIKFHRLVMKFPDIKFDIDHIDGNQLNNRKYNLRICSHAENTRNTKIPKHNTSGYIGVHFRNDTKRYSSCIEHNTKRISLGCFEKMEDAIIVRLKKEKELWGKFAPQRNLFKFYNI